MYITISFSSPSSSLNNPSKYALVFSLIVIVLIPQIFFIINTIWAFALSISSISYTYLSIIDIDSDQSGIAIISHFFRSLASTSSVISSSVGLLKSGFFFSFIVMIFMDINPIYNN